MARAGARGRILELARRLAVVLGCVVAIGIAYRVAFVYELRPGECEVGSGVALATPGGNPAAREAAAAPEPRRSAARPIRVLTYNIEGHAALVRPDHLAEVAKVIRDAQPDVVALQEVHRGTWQARFADQAAELARLTGTTAVFGPSFTAHGGDFGNAILTRGAIAHARVVRLPSLGEPRSLLSATVTVDRREVDVLVTHLAAWGSLNRAIRRRQATCLVEHVRTAGRPLVLAGDLNATPGSPEVAALLAGDLARLTGDLDEPTHPLLRQRIDYVATGPGWRVDRTAVLHAGPSDHWPVLAELTPLAPPPPGSRHQPRPES